MVKAILFDMDGVLVDSIRTHFCAFNATVKKFGGESISPETFRKKFWGTYIENDAKIVFEDINEQKLREIVEEYPLQIERFAEHTKIYPDTKKVLSELKKKGLKTGLVSSSQSKIVDILLKHVGLESSFDIIICGDQVKRPKPAPDGIFKACELLGLKPTEAIYVGDNHMDVTAGKLAGCFTIGVTTTSSREGLKGADIIIDSLTQLLDSKIYEQ